MAGPLAGLRVVDCSTGTAGPRATGLLADYGADVVWVEPPGGDPMRVSMPIESAVFNRGKRSVELDLLTAQGRQSRADLLQNADLLVETWAPGEADALSDEPSHLVRCSITGFGPDGSLSSEANVELIAQALSGVMGEQVGWREGPIPSAIPFASIGAAYLAVLGSLGAVCRAREDGIGRHVETSLLDGALSYLSMLWGLSDDSTATGAGAGHQPGTIRLLSSSYVCSDDEYLGIHTGAVGAFSRCMKVLGLDARIPPTESGLDMGTMLSPEQSKLVIEEIPKILAGRPRSYWLERLLAADVCAVPHLRPGEVFDEPQARHNEMSVMLDDPVLGLLEQVAPPAKFSRTVPAAPTPAPTIASTTFAAIVEGWQVRSLLDVRRRDGATDRPIFDGLKVLDLGAYFAGPYTSRLLGDLGADVIKLEPLAGDQLRGLARVFRSASANKRSISADLKQPALAKARDGLVGWADVVHHNMRPGAAERLGVGYESVAAANPRAIYLYAPGWGSSGPDRDRQSFAPMMSGYVGAGLEVAGRFNPPLFPLGNEDPGNGLLGAVAIAMALYERQSSGLGQYIENPQLNATMAHLAHVVRRPNGETLGAMRLDPLQFGFGALQRVYECSDGWIALALDDADATTGVVDDAAGVADDSSVGRLSTALGIDIVGDRRFVNRQARLANDDDLADVIAAVLRERSAGQAVTVLREHGVAAAIPVGYAGATFPRDPQHQRSGRVGSVDDGQGSTWRAVGTLVRVSGTVAPPFRLAPALGADTDSILRTVGYHDRELTELRQAKAIR